jgi:alanine dehydrogenase
MYESNQFPLGQQRLFPQEEMLEIRKSRKQLLIGVPAENQNIDHRIPLTPQAVELLCSQGHTVLIERGAGNGANYKDIQFSEAGAQICDDRKRVFESEIVLKVAPFRMNDIEHLNINQTIISALHHSAQSFEELNGLIQKKVKAIAFENLRGDMGEYPIIRSMSEIAGKLSICIAAEYLSKQHGGKGVLLGGLTGISPAEVMIIGADTAAIHAAFAAYGLGASVKVFSDSINKLRQFQLNFGHQIFTSIMQPMALTKALRSADVVVGAFGPEDILNVPVITREMVMQMKPGTIIVDLNIDNGSCFETSRITNLNDPVFTEFGVLHFCLPNIASIAARTASIALSNILAPILSRMGDEGGTIPLLKNDKGIRNGVYIFNGILTNHSLGQSYGIQSKDINLLMAAF